MIKYLLIIFNSFILFLYGIFNGDNGLSVTSTIPATMVGGAEVPIEITITKGAMNGFAKLQLDLPAEFQIKEVDEKGATYTFNEGIAKWVWAALPTENEIVIKLVIVPASDNLGPKTISAKYSYVENNVKQVVEMSPAEVNVVTQEEADRIASGTTKPATPVAAVSNESLSNSTSLSEPNNAMSIKRKVTKVSATEFEVFTTIAKGSTKGFARYSDVLPPDVELKKSETEGAAFSVADGKIKFVWVNAPEKDTLKISYLISSSRIQAIELKGEYTYLEDNQSKSFEAEPLSVAFETPTETKPETSSLPVANTEAPKPGLTELPSETKPKIAANEEKPVASTPKVNKKAKTSKPAKSKTTQNQSDLSSEAMASTDGMIYHVQIGAFTKKTVTASKLEKKFGVSERINSEMAEGYTKFMVGDHAEYKEARDHREVMINNHKIRSSFVVAYNNGKRITVQEALSITNQKWYK